jgi:hypothetical protein
MYLCSQTLPSLDGVNNNIETMTKEGNNVNILWNTFKTEGNNVNILWNTFKTEGNNVNILWNTFKMKLFESLEKNIPISCVPFFSGTMYLCSQTLPSLDGVCILFGTLYSLSFKKGDKHLPENYRPVSFTSVPCKLLEHIICRHLMKHLVI